jgi:hypothetical protein
MLGIDLPNLKDVDDKVTRSALDGELQALGDEEEIWPEGDTDHDNSSEDEVWASCYGLSIYFIYSKASHNVAHHMFVSKTRNFWTPNAVATSRLLRVTDP